MRYKHIKPKVAKQVAMPDDLKTFFRYANSLIEAGDNAAISSSDDLIQGPHAYGGLVEDGGDQYAFTYFTSSHTHPCWQIDATASEVKEIADGSIISLSLWGCTSANCGNLFPSPEDVCFYCDYVDDERDARDGVMPQLVNSPSRAEWVRGYLKHFPDDHPMRIIGAYNSQPNLGERLGWFNTEEIERLIAEAKQ